MLTPLVQASEMKKRESIHSSINSSNESYSPKRKKDSPNKKKSMMGAFVPKDCAVDIDKDYMYSIGKDIFRNVSAAQQ